MTRASLKLAALLAAAVLFGSIPVIAVVTHKRTAPSPAEFFEPGRKATALALYDKDGNQIAYCGSNDGGLASCEIEEGYNLNDVMNAWLHAYEDK